MLVQVRTINGERCLILDSISEWKPEWWLRTKETKCLLEK